MMWLTVNAYLLLLRTGFTMATRGFPALHRLVRSRRVSARSTGVLCSTETLCKAMDWACVFYPKQVLCLQRSAATTLLLRRHGVQAEMFIGAQLLPFKSHAWVEVDGIVVNDKPYMREIYRVLERC
jgi:hypothetical protein